MCRTTQRWNSGQSRGRILAREDCHPTELSGTCSAETALCSAAVGLHHRVRSAQQLSRLRAPPSSVCPASQERLQQREEKLQQREERLQQREERLQQRNVEVGILLHRHNASKGIDVYARFSTQPSLAKPDCAAFIGTARLG